MASEGVYSRQETRDLKRASVTNVIVVQLKLEHNCIDFRLFDVVNHVLGIRRSCTKTTSESVSDCSVP